MLKGGGVLYFVIVRKSEVVDKLNYLERQAQGYRRTDTNDDTLCMQNNYNIGKLKNNYDNAILDAILEEVWKIIEKLTNLIVCVK